MSKKKEKVKNIPIRTCVVTREKLPKIELMRIVEDPETKELIADYKNNIRARGANLKMDLTVFDEMVKRNVLPNALKLDRKISSEEYERLRINFANAIEERNFRKGNEKVKVRITKDMLTSNHS